MSFIQPLFKKIGLGDTRKKDKGDDLAKHLPESAYTGGEQASGAAASAQDAGPVNLTHLWADEPNAVRVRANRVILPLGDKRTYEQPDEATEAPLARVLLDVEGVESVVLDGSTITVFMDEEAEWDPIIDQVPQVITAHLEAGLPAVEGVGKAPKEKKYSFGFRQVTGRPREEQIQIVKDLLEREINPAVASHGGFFTLIDVKDNTVYVQLGGGCQGCGMVDVTLRQGVEQRMKEVLPEMVALVDTTDHAAGNNPYYTPGK